MPVAGRKPNPDGQRRHRVKPVHDWTEVQNIPFEAGPTLPSRPYHRTWPAATKRWWAAISRMPHCVLWMESDWQFAFDTAMIAAAFHMGELGQARELRQREKIMGTTADALRDLRIRYVEGTPEEESAGITAIDDYKRRLAKRPR